MIAPAVLIDFLSSAEDRNLKYQFANLLKLVRALALFVTLLLPGLYVAITTFHQELVPTELLFAIVASRSNVPFPIIFEILIMEVSLELIRESGVRVPAPLGQAIGIVRCFNIRRCISYCKYCKSYTRNYSCHNWYNSICCSRLLFKFSCTYCKIYIYYFRLFCRIFRHRFLLCNSYNNTCSYKFFWCSIFKPIFSYFKG